MSLHVLVSGAGIAGLTLAISLAKSGNSVSLFDKSAEFHEIGAGIQQASNAMQIHAALGINKQIESLSFEPESIDFYDLLTTKKLFTSDLLRAHKKRYGYKYLHIHRSDLHRTLLNEAKKHNINIYLKSKINSYVNTKNGVSTVINGETFRGDVLIGADGIRSSVRKHLKGVEMHNYTGYSAWRGLVRTSKLPPNLIPRATNNWLGENKHIVCYYVKNGDYVNFVAVTKHKKWLGHDWKLEGSLSQMRNCFKGSDSRIQILLNNCHKCYLWGIFDIPPLDNWTDGHVTLIGDAAHPMLPFLAQGASVAMEDAWTLTHYLNKYNKNIELGLKKYQETRLPTANLIQKYSKENADLYHMNPSFNKRIRDLKFSIATKYPALLNHKFDKVFGNNVVSKYPIEFI
jgi:salicylate hydroxylase